MALGIIPAKEGPLIEAWWNMPDSRQHQFTPAWKTKVMLSWSLTFLILALIAGILGFGGIAGAAAGIAKILFFIFLVLLIVSALSRALRGKTP